MTRAIVASLAAFAVLVHAAPTPAALNKCAAAKRLCAAKEIAALLACHAKAAKPPGLKSGKLEACLQKAKDKFDGGVAPAKGCFAKLEAKFPGACLTTGDASALHASAVATIAATNCALDPDTCLPETCLDVRNAGIAAGQALSDGSYTLFVGRNPNRPWTVFCRSMATTQPSAYLSVDESKNYSQISDGAVLTVSSYRRLRIDPVTFVVDLLDDTFATTDDGTLPPPSGRTSVPAGLAEFRSANDNDGPPAQAKIDVGGTGFAMTSTVLANNLEYFCPATDDATTPDAGNTASVTSDLTSFTLSALDPRANHTTKMVADCPHLSVADGSLATGSLPLQYVGP
jgi:GON domain-containing protein